MRYFYPPARPPPGRRSRRNRLEFPGPRYLQVGPDGCLPQTPKNLVLFHCVGQFAVRADSPAEYAVQLRAKMQAYRPPTCGCPLGFAAKNDRIGTRDVFGIIRRRCGTACSAQSARIGADQDARGAGARTGAIQQAGGWKSARMVARYSPK